MRLAAVAVKHYMNADPTGREWALWLALGASLLPRGLVANALYWIEELERPRWQVAQILMQAIISTPHDLTAKVPPPEGWGVALPILERMEEEGVAGREDRARLYALMSEVAYVRPLYVALFFRAAWEEWGRTDRKRFHTLAKSALRAFDVFEQENDLHRLVWGNLRPYGENPGMGKLRWRDAGLLRVLAPKAVEILESRAHALPTPIEVAVGLALARERFRVVDYRTVKVNYLGEEVPGTLFWVSHSPRRTPVKVLLFAVSANLLEASGENPPPPPGKGGVSGLAVKYSLGRFVLLETGELSLPRELRKRLSEALDTQRPQFKWVRPNTSQAPPHPRGLDMGFHGWDPAVKMPRLHLEVLR